MNRLIAGAVAGAVGTLALDIATYADMLIRGRPASEMPAKVAHELADAAGVSLEMSGDTDQSAADNRAQAIGALLGMANGVGMGVGYSLIRTVVPRPPRWLATGFVGGMAMVASDYPAVRLGITNPKKWSQMDWLSDVIPHAIYGAVTTASFDHMKK